MPGYVFSLRIVSLFVCFFTVVPYASVSFSHSVYNARESDGKVAVTIVASRYHYSRPFAVKIKSSVSTHLRPYGMVK